MVTPPDWKVESFRITLLNGNIGPSGATATFFPTLFGRPADEQTRKPALNQILEKADMGSYLATIAQQPGRLDVIVSDKPPTTSIDPSAVNYKPFFMIGDYKSLKDVPLHIGSKLFDLDLRPERIALAPTLILPAENQVEANRLLVTILPTVKINPESDTDILWQRNRPRPSRNRASEVNCFCRWQVIRLTAVALPALPLPNFTVQGNQVSTSAENVALRLEMDINLHQSDTEGLRPDDYKTLWEELCTIVGEIAADGDRP